MQRQKSPNYCSPCSSSFPSQKRSLCLRLSPMVKRKHRNKSVGAVGAAAATAINMIGSPHHSNMLSNIRHCCDDCRHARTDCGVIRKPPCDWSLNSLLLAGWSAMETSLFSSHHRPLLPPPFFLSPGRLPGAAPPAPLPLPHRLYRPPALSHSDITAVKAPDNHHFSLDTFLEECNVM